MKISKTAGARLKPHAPRLIPALLEALSTLEPAVLNYLSLRATEQEKVTPPCTAGTTSGGGGFHVGTAPGVSPCPLSLCSLFLQNAMDAARLSAAKSSPMMETVNMVMKKAACVYIETSRAPFTPSLV